MGIDYDNQYQVDIPLTVSCFAHTAVSMHGQGCMPCCCAGVLHAHLSPCCMLQTIYSCVGIVASAVKEQQLCQHILTLLCLSEQMPAQVPCTPLPCRQLIHLFPPCPKPPFSPLPGMFPCMHQCSPAPPPPQPLPPGGSRPKFGMRCISTRDSHVVQQGGR